MEEPLTKEECRALDRADARLNQNGGKGIPHEDVLAKIRGLDRDTAMRILEGLYGFVALPKAHVSERNA